jgi:hypothetical protein
MLTTISFLMAIASDSISTTIYFLMSIVLVAAASVSVSMALGGLCCFSL